jgi:DNA-directed RNA polymerase beta' subunit
MRASRLLIAALVPALSGCSSATRSGPEAPPSTVTTRIEGTVGATHLSRTNNAAASRVAIARPVRDVWEVMPDVYKELSIPVELLVPHEHRIGIEALRIRRKLGDLPLHRVLDCGGTPGAPNAETYEVTMVVLTQLSSPSAGETVLATLVQGTARSPNFGGAEVACTSNGVLEKRMEEVVRARLSR